MQILNKLFGFYCHNTLLSFYESLFCVSFVLNNKQTKGNNRRRGFREFILTPLKAKVRLTLCLTGNVQLSSVNKTDVCRIPAISEAHSKRLCTDFLSGRSCSFSPAFLILFDSLMWHKSKKSLSNTGHYKLLGVVCISKVGNIV